MEQSRTLKEVEETLICPMFGYRDVAHYYADASCAGSLPTVTIPLLCINAADDPIAVADGVCGAAANYIEQYPTL